MRQQPQGKLSAAQRHRDDIDPSNTWVVSDTHFGHDNIVGFCYRPIDHENVMIDEWRKVVPDNATLLHLGDLCYRGNGYFKNITASHLTGGRKLLIRGNHDKGRTSFYKQCGFKTIAPFYIFYRNRRVSFSHYPWSEEDGAITSHDLRIHGHIHNNGYSRESYVPFRSQHINISVEQTKYRPVNLANLLEGYLA